MLKQRARIITFLLLLADEAATAASFFLAFWLRADIIAPLVRRPIYPLEKYLFILAIILPVWGLVFWFFGLYRSHRTVSLGREAWEVVRAVAAGGLFLSLAVFLTRSDFLSRSLIVIFLAVNVLLLVALRLSARAAGRAARAQGRDFRNILIVGTDERAAGFATTIRAHPGWGMRILGYLDPDGGLERAVEPAAVLGTIRDLARVVQERVVDEVIFVVPPGSLATFEEAFLLCEEQGVRTRVVMEYLPRLMAKLYVESVDGIPVMTLTTAPIDVNALFVKRAADVLLSLLLLLVASPFMLLVALLVKLTSPGPVLFRQERVGLNGRRFTLLKFRSMYRDAEERKADLAHLNEMDGPVFKVRNDPRVTPVGRWIRAFSLDELPQLINVLRGDMSFVGPRPPIPEEVSRYERWQRRRLSMKPGLTCLWQISGRNEVDFQTWMKMDLDYIDHWSLWLDVKIILKTIPVVLSRRGAM